MIRLFIVMLLTLSAPFASYAQEMRAMNQVSIVALIVTSGSETEVSASVTETLESLDAQTLTANAPNASEMRSILKRFAAAAIDTDVALVYYDGAVLQIGERGFVVPGGIQLNRRSDLLTKAIPLSALARASALAIEGGAVLVHASDQDVALIEGITFVEGAPAPRMGTSPILFAGATAAKDLAQGLSEMAAAEGDIELNAALAGLAGIEGVSVSQIPTGLVALRQVKQETPEEVMAEMATEPVEDAMAAVTEAVEDATGLALPQVAPDETTQAGAEEPADESYAASVAETVEALEAASQSGSEIITEPVDTTVETVVINPDANADSAPADETPADPETDIAEETTEPETELSLEVLRAMQGALSRSEKRALQQSLRTKGFYSGLIDGIFGPQTARAISAYQDSISAEVTGVLTPGQLEALTE